MLTVMDGTILQTVGLIVLGWLMLSVVTVAALGAYIRAGSGGGLAYSESEIRTLIPGRKPGTTPPRSIATG